MEEQLKTGRLIKTVSGKTIRIGKVLGEGGQGTVYEVKCDGEAKALKWYKKSELGKKADLFYDNLLRNIRNGAPSEEFLWPQELTEWTDGTFGYVMDLRPEGYYEITDYMLCHVRFASYRAVVTAALKIVSAFRILHNHGYSYQDLNDGNFFIHPESGKVLICDNDNVAPDRMETGIIGKPRYMAPEVVTGSKPDSLSDRFSLSILLYILFCLNHPLEGKHSLVPCLSPELQMRLYGTEPVFIMDPDDHSNGPHPVVHRNSIAVWSALPEYMKQIFVEAFSQKSMKKPSARPTEIEWLKALTRFRSEIVPCKCGNEIFTENGRSVYCDVCNRLVEIPYRLEMRLYSIPAIRDSRIYKCQLMVCDGAEALDPIAQVVQKNGSGELGLRNCSGKAWQALTPSGRQKKVAAGEVVPLRDGIRLIVDGEEIQILQNA